MRPGSAPARLSDWSRTAATHVTYRTRRECTGCRRRGTSCATGPSWSRCAVAASPKCVRSWGGWGQGNHEGPARVFGSQLLDNTALRDVYLKRVK